MVNIVYSIIFSFGNICIHDVMKFEGLNLDDDEVVYIFLCGK